MIPQGLIAALAAARLGAIHAVVFGGFGANALAQRIDSANPKVILTTSCGLESSTKIIDYQPLVRGALKMCKAKPDTVLVWNRPQHKWPGGIDHSQDELDWDLAVKDHRAKGIKADCVPLKSEDGLYIIYTSGTTGMTLFRRRLSARSRQMSPSQGLLSLAWAPLFKLELVC